MNFCTINMPSIIIAIMSFVVVSGFFRLLINYDKYYHNNLLKYNIITSTIVFTVFGIYYFLHYLFSAQLPFLYWQWLLATCLTGLALNFNFIKVQDLISSLKNYQTSSMESEQIKAMIDTLQCQSVANIIMGKVCQKEDTFNIIWANDGFIKWLETTDTINLNTDVRKINDLDLYKILPIPLRWKNDHFKVLRENQSYFQESDYWKETQQYIKWEIIPAPGKIITWIFIDCTKETSLLKQQNILLASLVDEDNKER